MWRGHSCLPRRDSSRCPAPCVETSLDAAGPSARATPPLPASLNNLVICHVYLFPASHIFQRVLARRDFVVADDQGIASALLVRQLHRALQLSFRRELDADSGAAQIAREHTRMAERGFAERRDEQ